MRPIGPGKGPEEPSGDTAAEEIVEHIAALRRYALLLIGDRSDADDVVQEALTRVLAKSSEWSKVRGARAYLFATLHNVYVDHLRKQKRAGVTVELDTIVPQLMSPADQIKRLEVRDLLWALGKLPVEQRQIVLMIGAEGMSYAEAAEAASVPIGTVMSRLSRGREALRQLTDRREKTKLRVVK